MATTKKSTITSSKKANKPAVKTAKKSSTATKEVVKAVSSKKQDDKATPKVEILNPFIYPIGKCKFRTEYSETVINKLIQDIRILPEHLKAISKKVNKKKKLQYRYRENGWNIEQILHHVADSHLNAYIRFKCALTENNPTIKPYDENLWTETADIQLPLKNSVRLVKALHAKWVSLLENMDKNDFKRTYFHPAYNRAVPLQEALALYAWHGKHHVAQIEVALKIN